MRKIVSVLLVSVLIFSCKKSTNVPLSFDYGTVKDEMYHNTFFKFKMPVNPDWYVLNNEEADELYKIGNEYATGDNTSLKKTLDASMINVAKLFNVFREQPGTTIDYNPSIIVNAENLKAYPGKISCSEYLAKGKELLDQSAMDIEYTEERDNVQIGSQDFVFMQIKNRAYGIEINQDYYVTLKEGFALSFIMSYTTKEEKVALYEMFDKLKI